ncbi:MAG: hypothetical protein ACRC5T_11080 [Cetobacterium sp.]
MTNIIQIDEKLQSHVSAAVQKASEIIIQSESDLTTSTDIVKFIKEKAKQVEIQRKNFVDPINASVKNINAQFKALSEPLEKAEAVLKGKMLDFQRKLEAEKRVIEEIKRKEVEELARQQTELQKQAGEITEQEAITFNKQLDFAMTKPIEVDKVRGSATGATSSIRKRWTFKVTDIKALANARPDLVEVLSVNVRREIANGTRELAGIEIYQEDELAIR